MNILNYTPHPIKVVNPDKSLTEFASHGIARCAAKSEKVAEVDGIPCFTTKNGQVENLPEQKPGVALIVSALVRTQLPILANLLALRQATLGISAHPPILNNPLRGLALKASLTYELSRCQMHFMENLAETANSFTYCGDLVGISSIYSNAPDQAYNLVSQFYNTAYTALEEYQKQHPGSQVFMISDSLIVTGDDYSSFIPAMCDLYMSLLNGCILLRGGMVRGRLAFEPRKTRPDFEKKLPPNAILAKASALEKATKGARFVIEPEIAHELLSSLQNWLTLQGYINEPMQGKDMALLRSISPLPTGGGYEVLYPVFVNAEREIRGLSTTRASSALVNRVIDKLAFLECSSSSEIVAHYSETLRLLRHSMERRRHMKTQESIKDEANQ